MIFDTKQHWETVYKTKKPDQVSWTQEIPKTSLDFINSFQLSKDASIIDIGGGDSNLVDFLLEEGYSNITVLDISGKALERAKKRLGKKGNMVTWIESNVIDFNPEKTYDIWHDRAAFHFLTSQDQVSSYVSLANRCVKKHLIIGTFSMNGPQKCSGLNITQYSKNKMSRIFTKSYKNLKCIEEIHNTPFNTTQNFIFCSFKKR
ncbi:MAG: Trans-aconitate 2-methyltransferase [Flavobacterium sp. SCGC AAA160-P02]|nr:MAG: Trans-aconitate 2-methyltransferase [Flavobacterium sp. SCGC AAA160-P02]